VNVTFEKLVAEFVYCTLIKLTNLAGSTSLILSMNENPTYCYFL